MISTRQMTCAAPKLGGCCGPGALYRAAKNKHTRFLGAHIPTLTHTHPEAWALCWADSRSAKAGANKSTKSMNLSGETSRPETVEVGWTPKILATLARHQRDSTKVGVPVAPSNPWVLRLDQNGIGFPFGFLTNPKLRSKQGTRSVESNTCGPLDPYL